jgi:hypothetical protein
MGYGTLSATMGFKEAQDAIGNALKNLVNDVDFFNRAYPYPDNLYPEAGKPSMTVRWDGISADNDGDPDYLVPAGFRYEIRIYHPQYAPADANVTDGYIYAQEKVGLGTGLFFEALAQNRRLNGLVLDIVVDGSLAGDLLEPRTETDYYGHEMLLDVRLHDA